LSPNITGGESDQIQVYKANKLAAETWSGALFASGFWYASLPTGTSDSGFIHLKFDASKSNAKYGANSKVQNPAISVLVAIRY
jgi:hypothetical protein